MITTLEITERLIRAAEVMDRLPSVGPARLKAMSLPYVHTATDMSGWGRRPGERDFLLKEDFDRHATHRREFWEKSSISARDVSDAEEALSWYSAVTKDEWREALAGWVACMSSKKLFFKDWCKRAGVSEKTGRKRKDAAVLLIYAHLARYDVQNNDIDRIEGLLDTPETGDEGARVGNAWRPDHYQISQTAGEPDFSWADRRNAQRRSQRKERQKAA